MDEIKDLVLSILEQGYLMSLATIDEKGPWVSDVIFVHDDELNIYWLSMEHTRHSKALLKHPKVACSITVSNGQGEANKGLQIAGTAEKVEGDILPIAIKHRLKRGRPAPDEEGEILDKGESWYRLVPSKIELIFEPKFGYTKKTLDLNDSPK